MIIWDFCDNILSIIQNIYLMKLSLSNRIDILLNFLLIS